MDPIFCLYRQDTPLFLLFVPAWRGFHNPSKPLPLQDIFVRLSPESEPLRGGWKGKIYIVLLKDKIDNDDDVKWTFLLLLLLLSYVVYNDHDVVKDKDYHDVCLL